MLLLLKELRERTHKRWFFFGMQVLVIISSRHGDFWNCDQDTGKRTVGIKHDHAVVRCHTISGSFPTVSVHLFIDYRLRSSLSNNNLYIIGILRRGLERSAQPRIHNWDKASTSYNFCFERMYVIVRLFENLEVLFGRTRKDRLLRLRCSLQAASFQAHGEIMSQAVRNRKTI